MSGVNALATQLISGSAARHAMPGIILMGIVKKVGSNTVDQKISHRSSFKVNK